MLKVLEKLTNEGHGSERTAGWFHVGFAALYALSIAFHLFAAHRHFKDAAEKKKGLDSR